jgi:hypothetical protein
MDLLAELGSSLATLNVWGDHRGDSGKLEQLVRDSVAMHIGILALQETKTIVLEHRVTQDKYHREWHMAHRGTQHTPKSGGAGFLASPQIKVLEFVPISHHVTWIRVHRANYKGVDRSAMFVTSHRALGNH